MARLAREQWQTIRIIWDYDPDEPSFDLAAASAAKKYEFKAPRRQSVHERARAEAWQRRGSFNGINAAAHRRADYQMNSAAVPQPAGLPDGAPPQTDTGGAAEPDVAAKASAPALHALLARESDVDKRTATNVRHRQEWVNIAVLRNEALSLRNTDPVRCSERFRQVKAASKITATQQVGERKAWSLDIPIHHRELASLSDEALEAIAAGRRPS